MYSTSRDTDRKFSLLSSRTDANEHDTPSKPSKVDVTLSEDERNVLQAIRDIKSPSRRRVAKALSISRNRLDKAVDILKARVFIIVDTTKSIYHRQPEITQQGEEYLDETNGSQTT
jgi:hypothetical protein